MRPTAYRIHTSQPADRAFTPRGPQRAAIRHQMHGRIQPMDPKLVRMGRRIPSTRIAVAIAIIAATIFAVQLLRPSAASVARPLATGTTAASLDAGRR